MRGWFDKIDFYEITIFESLPYHNLDAPLTASTLLDEIEAIVSNLSIMPLRYGLVDDAYLRRKEFRKYLIKNYIIFYKVNKENKTVMIHRILHARQKWIDIL